MKNAFLFSFFSIFVLYTYGQTDQKGTVTLFNSGKKPLAGTEILAIGAPPTDTDANGNFTLTLPKAAPGQALVVSSIHKKGYELVNEQILYSWIISEKRPMNVVMAPIGTINESKEKFYIAGMKQVNMQLGKEQEKLNSLYRAGKLTLEQREEKLISLRAETTAQKKALDQYADYFARINPDEITDLEKKVFNLIEQGKMEQAITLYQQSEILEQAIKQLNISIKESEIVENYISILYRYANTCMLAGDENNRKKAEGIYKKIAEDNLDNYRYVNTYANFLLNTASKDVTIWCEKAAKLASSDAELVQSLFFLVCAYGGQLLLEQNKVLMQKSYERFSACIKDPDLQIAPAVRDTYFLGGCTILPVLLLGIGNYEEALKENDEALKSIKRYEELYGSDQSASREIVYSNIVLCYDAMKNWDMAQKYNDKYYELLLSHVTDQEDKRVILFDQKTRITEYAWLAEKNLNKTETNAWDALEIGKHLKKIDFKTAGNFCTVYFLLGVSAQKKGNDQQGLALYKEGYKHELSLSNTQMHGIFNFPAFIAWQNIRLKQYEEAIHWNEKAMEVAAYMENYNIEKGAAGIAMAYFGKGSLSMAQKDTVTAQACYEKAVNLFTLYPNSQSGMESLVSYALNQLSGIYYKQHNSIQALQVSHEAQALSLQKMKESPQDIEKQVLHAYNCSYSGSIELELQQSREAIKDIKAASDIYIKLAASNEQVYLLHLLLNELNLSFAFYMNKDLKQAEDVLNRVNELSLEAAKKFPSEYGPMIYIVQLCKGDLYEKKGHIQQGKAIAEKALEELKAYSENPIVAPMIEYYKAGEYYRDKKSK